MPGAPEHEAHPRKGPILNCEEMMQQHVMYLAGNEAFLELNLAPQVLVSVIDNIDASADACSKSG